jgi:hypothetical protein
MIATAPRSLDVEIGMGRTIRVSRVETEHGPTVVLAVGFGAGTSFRRPSWCGDVLALPASCLPSLSSALAELGAEVQTSALDDEAGP